MDDYTLDQFWFWEAEWQAGEQKVDEYIADGKFEEFDTMKEFLLTLREECRDDKTHSSYL